MPLMGNEFNRFFEVYWVCFGISAMGQEPRPYGR